VIRLVLQISNITYMDNVMKRNYLPRFVPTSKSALLAIAMFAFTVVATAQSPQLSLADLLIGLRSQKATLPERNTILTEAVKERGVTFVYTPEIAKELAATGASPELLSAIVAKTTPAKSFPTPTPVPTPTPPDYSFYQKRADSNFVKGEFSLALADYDKAAQMRSDDAAIYLGRGRAHMNLKSYDRSVADFDKVIELNPKESSAFLNRGVSFERLGEREKAVADYKAAVDLDKDNEIAKSNLQRLQDEISKEEAAKAAAARAAARPAILEAGALTVAQAEKMALPIYSPAALKSNIEGRVSVEVEVDESGRVTKAEAVSGHQMLRTAAEDAARKSKFKPFTWDGTPIKARGLIVYNFTRKPGEE
jgi:TonB family protein